MLQKVTENGCQLVTEKDIKAPDRDDPSFREALKILPDCDIYEKVTAIILYEDRFVNVNLRKR